jgi:hypothetical protein
MGGRGVSGFPLAIICVAILWVLGLLLALTHLFVKLQICQSTWYIMLVCF